MGEEKIPKVIHYCWFGRNPKPDIIKKCIASWEKYCSDWEIKEWNEDNFDITLVPYMKEAYDAKKWAFVSDVARLILIYQLGGVYLDTDVELLKPIDELVNVNAFFAFENSRNIASGLGFGAIKGHKAVAAMLAHYEGKRFLVDGIPQLIPCPSGNTKALKSIYPCFERNGLSQNFDKIKILSGKEYSEYAVHHGTATWVKNACTNKKYKSSKIKNMLRNPEIFKFLEKMNPKIVKLYEFLVYDFWEYGLIYFIKRKLFNGKE